MTEPLDPPGQGRGAEISTPENSRASMPEADAIAPLRGIKLVVAYDGTNYKGWQSQRRDGQTIQEILEVLGKQIAGERVSMHASGRTDAGVHALGQVISFQTRSRQSPEVWRRAFNGHLPSDIAVLEAAETPPEFHARVYAQSKRYRYLLHDGPLGEILAQRFLWQVTRPLDLAAMRTAAAVLVGRHDFRAFESGGSRRLNTVRTVSELTLTRPFADGNNYAVAQLGACALFPPLIHPEHLLVLEIEADGFLYKMVRTIAGTLVQVGKGMRPAAWAAEVLAGRDRRRAGQTAPAAGLYLLRVAYP